MPSITTRDGTEIFYKDWGLGEPIVFSHGWPLSADDWDAQMMFFLNRGFRVVAAAALSSSLERGTKLALMESTLTSYWRPMLAMVVLIAASNWLVQFPIEAGAVFGVPVLITWAAFTYPATFLVTDLTNRRHGPQIARRVIYIGFAVGVALSALLATPRIALASGTAFLVAQLLDVTVFNWLRRQSWWRAPLFASLLGSAVDTAVFFSLAFAGTAVPWDLLALSDLVVKLLYALFALIPYRVYMALVRPAWAEPVATRA